MGQLRYAWREEVSDQEMVQLVRAHGGNASPGWWDRIRLHSLGWVSTRTPDGLLVGFVNVAWDGGDHAFLRTATSPITSNFVPEGVPEVAGWPWSSTHRRASGLRYPVASGVPYAGRAE